MKKVHNWFLPDHDTHYEYWFGINDDKEYQKPHRDHALKNVKHFRTAVDIGGNIGFWSKDFCEQFNNVIIFEPELSNIECLKENLKGHSNFTLHEVGLGSKEEMREFYISLTTSGGHTFNKEHTTHDEVKQIQLQIKTLDSYNLTNVDLIKIDTQGYELDVLQGARETLLNNDCVVNVEIEQKNPEQVKAGRPIFKLMESLGYIKLDRFKRDEVLFAKRKR